MEVRVAAKWWLWWVSVVGWWRLLSGVEEMMTMRWRWCYDDDSDDVMMVAVGV
ncbi:hypothetical protein Tco_0182494, partial [Tanacetum coccineum]